MTSEHGPLSSEHDRSGHERYFSVLTKTHHLAETLPCAVEPLSRTALYTVDTENPLFVPIDLPVELTYDEREHVATTFEFSSDSSLGVEIVDTVLALDFSDGSQCRLTVPTEATDEVGYYFIPLGDHTTSSVAFDGRAASAQQEVFEGTMPVSTVSELISRCVYPNVAPEMTDYRRLSTAYQRQEVEDMLKHVADREAIQDDRRRRPLVDIIEAATYEIDGHTISVVLKRDEVHEVTLSIPPLAPGERSVTMRSTFETSRYSSELYWSGADGREPIPLTIHEIEAFEETLDTILDMLAPQEVSCEELATYELNAVHPEEKSGSSDPEDPRADEVSRWGTPTVPGPDEDPEGLA